MPLVRIALACLMTFAATAFAQPIDPARGRALYASTNASPLSCSDSQCHGPDPARNAYRVLRGADNSALILNALGSVRTTMAFLQPYLSERDVVDIAAYLGEVSRTRAQGLVDQAAAAAPPVGAGSGGDAGAGGATTTPTEVSTVSPFNAGYGGCSVGLPGVIDPTLPGLAAFAMLMIGLRRRAGAVGRLAALALAVAVVAAPRPAVAIAAGDTAPAFTLAGLDGRPVSLAAERGRVVWLDFWASWCGPCRQSFPWMAQMQQRHGARGLRVVAVSVDTNLEDARRFVSRTNAPFPIGLDPSGELARTYAVRTMPTSVLIDGSGRVLAVHSGFKAADGPALERRIEQALDAMPRADSTTR
jgi:peroxiredoxin/cytochrome c553